MASIRKRFGQQTIGSSNVPVARVPRMVLQILYGQMIGTAHCIKYTANLPTELPEFLDLYQTSFSQEGVGTAYLWTDGSRSEEPVLVLNRNLIYPHALISGASVTTCVFENIKITGTGTSESNPIRFQEFYIPFGL